MATLTRSKSEAPGTSVPRLDTSIPKPFPSRAERELWLQDELLDDLANERVDFGPHEGLYANPPGLGESSTSQNQDIVGFQEVIPSIVYVQKSCLMTLNNLISSSTTRWSPIVPDRRHSTPSVAQSSSSMMPQPDTIQGPTSALHTLLTNLRSRDSDTTVEIHYSLSDTELIDELRLRVDDIASSLMPDDAQLARVLVSLISDFDRMSVIRSGAVAGRDIEYNPKSDNSLEPQASPTNVYDMLKYQLSSLQVERRAKGDEIAPGSPPLLAVENEMLWSKIDDKLEMVLSLCKERTERLLCSSLESHLPPQYDLADYEFDDELPEYEQGPRTSIDSSDTKTRRSLQINTAMTTTEKMRLDLEAVTMAIDRLYIAAPQLHNQRVELKSSKLAAMEEARKAGGKSAVSEGKQRERELDYMLDLIGKASERKITDQSVVLEGGMGSRLEKARQRDVAKRDAFAEQLANHSNVGRLHTQDAILRPPRVKDPETRRMTLPEFFRSESQKSSEARPTPPQSAPRNHVIVKSPSMSHLRNRSRSRSAPSLSWLRPSSSKSSSATSARDEFKQSKSSKSRPSTAKADAPVQRPVLDVHYVAEHHENLNHVLVFLTITNLTPGAEVQAQVLPIMTNSVEGDNVVIESGTCISRHLDLPVRTRSSKANVKVQNGHFELKLPTATTLDPDNHPSSSEMPPLWDATQLSASKPTGFICASCSLPLVQASKIDVYRDLPSEHWEELVDAWMCHADQTLHEQVARRGRGFWPDMGQALVGGSYILFEESAVVKNNIHRAAQPRQGEDWRVVRCICGAVSGRCQDHQFDANGVSKTVYRLVKYAIRPMHPTSEPSRVPLSAFIVEDMMEFVQAHATYRFVISDEEDERPRLLVWLFKPSIRLAYTTPRQYVMPRSGAIHAAKVLFKVIGRSTSSTDIKGILNKYPGFPQAEHLSYPIDICQRLANLLKESNTAYPESLRTMTGLDVGWLHRA